MTLVVASHPVDSGPARSLLAELDAEYVRRWGHGDDEPLRATDFVRPQGEFFVASLDGRAVGSGGWRGSGEVAEVKRMYVLPDARGRGVARAVLAAVERSAALAGRRSARLVTGELQPEATALYRSSGYDDVEPFGVYADGSSALFLGKALTPQLT